MANQSFKFSVQVNNDGTGDFTYNCLREPCDCPIKGEFKGKITSKFTQDVLLVNMIISIISDEMAAVTNGPKVNMTKANA